MTLVPSARCYDDLILNLLLLLRNFDSQDGINFHPRSGVRSAKPDNEDVKDEGESDKTSQKSDRVVFRDN